MSASRWEIGLLVITRGGARDFELSWLDGLNIGEFSTEELRYLGILIRRALEDGDRVDR